MDHILNFDAFEGIDYEKRQELRFPSRAPEFCPAFGGSLFLICVAFFTLCVPNVASFNGLSNFCCPFGFL